MSSIATVIHDSLKEFECGKYSQCLKTLESIQFPTFDLLEWVRDNNVTICSLVSKQYIQTASQIADTDSTRVTLGNLLTKIRSFNSTENNFGLVIECAVLYNLILLDSKNQPEPNSTVNSSGENLNSHLEITVKRILATDTYPSTYFLDNDPDSVLSKTVINESLLCCLRPVLYLWSCVVSTSEKQQLESLVKKLLAENSKEMVKCKWDLRFALPAAPGLDNKNPLSDNIGNNMTAMFQILDLALRTYSFHSQIAKQIDHIRWIPYIHYVQGYCLYRECEYQKALDVLNNLEQNFIGDILESFVLNLKGCCLFKLGNCWSGIQKFQSALKKNFSPLPLYNVTVIYRHQQKEDAELESLKYLVKALESKRNESKKCVEFCLNRFEISKSSSNSLLTLPYALYLQSHRSLQLKHFSQASEHFLDLLTVLMETPIFQPSDSNSTPIPGVAEIHLEAAFCMLSAERYPECIAICNWLLSCISDSIPASFPESFEESSIFDKNNHSDQEENDFLFGDSEFSKKRHHSEISSTNYLPSYAKHCKSEPSSVNDVLLSALLYKADAYFHLKEIENVFSCLQRATNIIKSEGANLIPASPELQPLSKRQKVSLKSQPTSDPNQVELKIERDYRNSLISSMYNNTGVLLQCRGQFQESLHCFRLGLQINSCDPSLNFNCALTLIQLKEVEEAALFWARHRQFDLSVNTVQLQKEISEKRKELEALQNANCESDANTTKITDPPTSCTLLRFDICILRRLLHSK